MNTAPLFYYGICLLLGVATAILFHPACLIVLAVLIFMTRRLSGMIPFILGGAWALFAVTLPTLPEEGVHGHGTFTPASVSYGHSPFGTSLITKGSLDFTTSTATWKRIPCQIYTPLHKLRPPGNCEFTVEGRLLPKTFPTYVLKPSHIQPKPSTFSLAEYRFQMKDWVRHQLKKRISSPAAASFLLSMVTGEIDDRLMALQFNRLGLLHLLGISGFQFSLLALMLGSLLRLLMPGAQGTLLLIALLSLYAFLLGNSPPIQRAWIGVTLYAVARLQGLQISALNALGAALIWQLLLDPCVFFQLGFQFSFLCTAAIFIVYPPMRDFFKRWLPGRSFDEICLLSPLDRAGHMLAFFCRETLALNLAIHLVSLPLIFFHFHKFPLLSLVYNLFLPPAVSLAYLFLIPGLLLTPFLKVAEFLTGAMLDVATNPPALFDFEWRVSGFTLSWTLLTLTLILGLFYERGRLLNSAWRR